LLSDHETGAEHVADYLSCAGHACRCLPPVTADGHLRFGLFGSQTSLGCLPSQESLPRCPSHLKVPNRGISDDSWKDGNQHGNP